MEREVQNAYQNSVCVTLLQVVMTIRKLSSGRDAICSWASKTMFFDPVPSLGAILQIFRLSHENYLLTLLSIKNAFVSSEKKILLDS